VKVSLRVPALTKYLIPAATLLAVSKSDWQFAGASKKKKHTTGGIPRWSPTLVLVARFSAYVWQSGRDAQFSLTYGRMYYFLCPKATRNLGFIAFSNKMKAKSEIERRQDDEVLS
jgi:hypothetical protein